MLSSRPLQIPLDDDASSSNFAHARTPARALLKHRSGALRENAVYHGSMTVKAKGKSVFQTPFNHTRKAPQTAIKAKGMGTPTILVSQPLGDKTPFPNRQQPPAQQLHAPKPQATKLLLEVDNADAQTLLQTPECLLLPSATRRRRSLRLPSAISKSLKTPATRGNHWDVSDGDIDLDAEEEGRGDLEANNAQSNATSVNTEAAKVDDDDDEIEYMPPKLPETPWTPPFDMPDYKTLGRALLRVAHGERVDDSLDVFYAQDVEIHIDVAALLHDSGAFSTVNLPLPALEDDDPFSIAARENPPFRPSSPPNRSRPTSVASTARTNSRPGTALARPTSQASTHSRTASIPTPDPIATRTRVRLGETSAMTNSRTATPAKGQGLQGTDPLRSAPHTTLTPDPSRATASRTVPAPTVTRRIQPPRAASSRSIESGPFVRPTTRTAGTATSKVRPTTTREPTTRPATTGDKDVKGTKPITSRSVASKPSSQPRAAGPSASGMAARPGPSGGTSDLVIDLIPSESEGADAEYFFEV